MNKMNIILLIVIAASIAVLIGFMGDLTTYETIASARQKPGKSVTMIAKVDNTVPMEYDPVKNPNYLRFTALDSLGNSIKVVYHNAKPTDMEKSERIVLKGSVEGDHFDCKDILLKCPSKYKDDVSANQQNVNKTMDPAGPKSYDTSASKTY